MKKKTSAGTKLAWRIAAAEAVDSGSPEIGEEHLLIGILSLETFGGNQDPGQESTGSNPLYSEWSAIEQVFSGTGIDASILDHLRARSVKAGKGITDAPVHRSEEVRRIFSRAAEFSGDHPVTCRDLLAALVENPGPFIGAQLFGRPGVRETVIANLTMTGRTIREPCECMHDSMPDPLSMDAFSMLRDNRNQLEERHNARFTDSGLLHATEYARIFDTNSVLPDSAIELLATAAAMTRQKDHGSDIAATGEIEDGAIKPVICTVTDKEVLLGAIERYNLPIQIDGRSGNRSLREEILRFGQIFQAKKSLENDILNKTVTLRRDNIPSDEIRRLREGIIRDKIRIAELVLLMQDIDGLIGIFTELTALLGKGKDTISPAISQLRFMQAEGIDLNDRSVKELLLLLKMVTDDQDISGSLRRE